MGEIFRKVCDISPISEDALLGPSPHQADKQDEQETSEINACVVRNGTPAEESDPVCDDAIKGAS